MFMKPTITWVPSGFSWYTWLDTKKCVKKINIEIRDTVYNFYVFTGSCDFINLLLVLTCL